MGWRFWLSDKTVRKFAELRIDCGRQKMHPHCTGDISVIRLFAYMDIPKRKRQSRTMDSVYDKRQK